MQFIGLSPESIDEAPNLVAFCERYGANWPVAYGAGETIDALGVEGFPTVTVFGPDGKAVWSGHDAQGADDAIAAALK